MQLPIEILSKLFSLHNPNICKPVDNRVAKSCAKEQKVYFKALF